MAVTDRHARPALQRPATGAAFDPDRMIQIRHARPLSRLELATKVTDRSQSEVARVLGIGPEILRPPSPGTRIPVAVLAQELDAAGITLADLERSLPPDVLPQGLSWDSITKYENGHRQPKRRTLLAICTALDCDLACLIHVNSLSGIPVSPASHERIPTDPLRNFTPKDSSDYIAQLAGRVLVKLRQL
jgi:transcriptional regulator with XRE-family HTH domain